MPQKKLSACALIKSESKRETPTFWKIKNVLISPPKTQPVVGGGKVPPKSVRAARRWRRVRAALALRLGAHKPTARWPPAPPSTALEAPVPGQPCPPGASAATRQLNIPKGPKKRARTRTTQIQMGQPPTTASPRSPGGSASRQATATALQGQQTHRRRPPGCAPMNLQTVSPGPKPV